MAKQRLRDNLPGNDGRWYLELVGVVEPAAESTDSYATLEDLVPPPLADDTATHSAGAAAAAVNGALVAGTTPNGEVLLFEEVGNHRRRRSWIALPIVMVLLIVAASLAVLALPRAVEDEADLLATRYRDALVAMRSELPRTQEAMADLTDPSASEATVSTVPAALADLSSVSARAAALATTPLPSTLPLVSPAPFEALEPTRASMTLLGAEGSDIAGRLGLGFTYRTGLNAMFGVDVLPSTASETAITEMSLALATDLAETGRLVAELPPDPVFDAARDAAVELSDRYATWQLEYLGALRDADDERAASLVAELDAALASLDDLTAEALAALRAELDAAIVELATELETAIASARP